MYIYIYILLFPYLSLYLYLCLYLCLCLYLYLHVYLYLYIYIYLFIFIIISISISMSISISRSMSISISISFYLKGLHYHRGDVQTASQPWTKPEYTLHQWNYCASLCLNLHFTCFQGACCVAYTPWVSHSTQHLACENRCFQSALGGRRCAPNLPSRFFLFKFKLAHFSIH